jgi:hypothetical protein
MVIYGNKDYPGLKYVKGFGVGILEMAVDGTDFQALRISLSNSNRAMLEARTMFISRIPVK